MVEKAGLNKSFLAMPYIRGDAINDLLRLCIKTPYHSVIGWIVTAVSISIIVSKRRAAPTAIIAVAAMIAKEGRISRFLHCLHCLYDDRTRVRPRRPKPPLAAAERLPRVRRRCRVGTSPPTVICEQVMPGSACAEKRARAVPSGLGGRPTLYLIACRGE